MSGATVKARKARARKPTSKMNDTESRFEANCLGQRIECSRRPFVWWRFEGITLRLADRTTYTPDFIAQGFDGSLWAFEVKVLWKPGRKARADALRLGKPPPKAKVGWREDARAKTKIAAALFEPIVFAAVWPTDESSPNRRHTWADWDFEVMPPHGKADLRELLASCDVRLPLKSDHGGGKS